MYSLCCDAAYMSVAVGNLTINSAELSKDLIHDNAIHRSVSLSVSLCLSVCLSVCVRVCPCVRLSMCPSVCLYLSVCKCHLYYFAFAVNHMHANLTVNCL